ncbi:MAG: alpha/beta hydrolase [Gammaproteobacteria bacterium]|nr:alpha/beta hydrolase [Gammaproteobacteria bacterium]
MFLFLAFGSNSTSHAATIQFTLNNGITALADYREGDKDKPVLLLLHGFLQTHTFSTIQSMTDELAASGYSVLAPTLSLGIDNRNQSLACDAIHTHQYGDHNNELDDWIDWLALKGHKNLILIGHSSGSLRLLSYIGLKRKQPLNITGLVSVSPTTPNAKNTLSVLNKQISLATKLAQNNTIVINKYHLAYCRGNYATHPAAFISYAHINEEVFFNFLKNAVYPVVHILGNEDKLAPENWNNKLSKHGAKVLTVNNANHFFSNSSEFDLHDAIYNAIDILGKASK